MGDYKPGDTANGHVLGEDLVWRPLDSTLQSDAPTSPAPTSPAPTGNDAWALAALSGLIYWVLALAFMPYPDGNLSYRTGFFTGHAGVAVVATALLVKRLENPWRVLLALVLPPLIAGMLFLLQGADRVIGAKGSLASLPSGPWA